MLPLLTLAEIKSEVDTMADKIGASGYILPTYGHTEDGARPHIEVDVRGYHFVVVERGRELRRITTNVLNDLLYAVFEGVTSILAYDYELMHRQENEDPRRMMFSRLIHLLAVLSPEWAERQTQYVETILRQYPFDDDALTRVRLSRSCSDQGHSDAFAWKKACEQYPLPRHGSWPLIPIDPNR